MEMFARIIGVAITTFLLYVLLSYPLNQTIRLIGILFVFATYVVLIVP